MTTMNIPVQRDPSFELTIDSRFEGLIPKVSPEAFKELEASILETGGPEKPLVVWKEILVDGHHRYRVCKKHGLPFATVSRDFETAAHAQLWGVNEHLSRRNMTSEELNAMRRRKVELLRATGLSKNAAVNQVAQSENVHPSTVRRSAKNEELREKLLEKVPDDVKDTIRSIRMSDLRSLAKLPVEKQREVIERCGDDQRRLCAGVKEAVSKLFPPPKPPTPSTPSPPPPSAPAPEPEEPAQPEEWDILPLSPPTNEQGKRVYLWAKGERNLERDVEQCIERLAKMTAAVATMRDRVRSTDQLGEIDQLTGQLYRIFLTWRGDVTRALEERKLKEQDNRDASQSKDDETHRLPKDRASPERVLQASR